MYSEYGLVDEQHAAERGVDQLPGLDRGRAEVLAHQVGPVRLDHLGPDQQAKGGEDAAEDAGDRGLAGPRRAGEHEMPGGRLAGQPLPVPQPGHPQLGGDLVHLPLDRIQADQLVQLGQGVLHRGRLGVTTEPGGELAERPLQVAGPQRHQLGGGRFRPARHHPDVAGLAGLLQQVPDEPAVAELVGDPAAADVLHHPGQGVARPRGPAIRHGGPGTPGPAPAARPASTRRT